MQVAQIYLQRITRKRVETIFNFSLRKETLKTMDTITAAINAYFAAISALNAEQWVATFAADGTSYKPGNPPLVGHDALRQFFNGIAAGFETIEMKPDQIFPLGNEAAVKWSACGKGRNLRTITFEGIDVFVVNEAGVIQSVNAYWNPAAMMAELMA
jgi:steroid Delta-isomerase